MSIPPTLFIQPTQNGPHQSTMYNYKLSGTNVHVYFGCRGKTPRNGVRILYENTRDWNGSSEMSFKLTKNTNCAYAMYTIILTKRRKLVCVCFWSWLNAGSPDHCAFTYTIAAKTLFYKDQYTPLEDHIVDQEQLPKAHKQQEQILFNFSTSFRWSIQIGYNVCYKNVKA